jgi:hypothetical protein
MEQGETVPDALNALEGRGVLFIAPGKGSTTAMPPVWAETGVGLCSALSDGG